MEVGVKVYEGIAGQPSTGSARLTFVASIAMESV
jgi:hypothetical protein